METKNPLFRNEYYFLSGMYDDSLITDFYRMLSSETYQHSIDYQNNMISRTRKTINSPVYDKINLGSYLDNADYLLTLGLPANSIVYKLHSFVLPIHDKKKFIRTYGVKNQTIPLEDFYKRKDIFDKAISLQIGRYRILKAYIIQDVRYGLVLAIPNSNVDGIPRSGMDVIFSEYSEDEPVWIFSDEITQVYSTNITAAASISSTITNNMYEVTINKSTALNNIGEQKNHEFNNSWDCLISVNSGKYGQYMLVTYPCTLKSELTSTLTFNVDSNFIDSIKAVNAAFNLIFINRPNRKHLMLYQYSESTSPIINLDYNYNPSSNLTVEVYEFDSENSCKGRRLYDPEFKQKYYPNIYDFNQLNKNLTNMLIEITEYGSSYTNQIMNDSISLLIDSLGHDFYTTFVVNGLDTNRSGNPINIQAYNPTYYDISHDDYMNSIYSGDIRGYMLDKIEKIIESDPYLLAKYYQWIQNLNRSVISLSGTPKKLRFGTGKTGEYSGANPIVNDTSFISQNPEDILYFDTPHSYFTYRSELGESPSMLYIDGNYVRPTLHRYYSGLNYIFYPVQNMSYVIDRYSTAESLTAAAPITLEFYPNAYNSLAAVPKCGFTIENITEPLTFFEDIEDYKIKLSDLVIYNEATGEILENWLDYFSVDLHVKQFFIDNPGQDDELMISREETVDYLLTSLHEIYRTMDMKAIILGANEKDLNLNLYFDELISNNIISEDEKMLLMDKEVFARDLTFTPKFTSMIGMTIGVYTKNFKAETSVIGNSFTDNGDGTYSSLFRVAYIDPSKNNYLLFRNGMICDFEMSPQTNQFSGDILVTISTRPESSDRFDLVHVPVAYVAKDWNYVLDESNQNAILNYMKPADTTGTSIDTIWPINDAIFENGMVFEVSDCTKETNNILSVLYPIEDATNMVFSAEGYRLPPVSRSMNRLGAGYYDSNRANNLPSTELHGKVYLVQTGIPFTSLYAKDGYCNILDRIFR